MTEPVDSISSDAPPYTARRRADRAAAAPHGENELVGHTVTINRPRAELYAFWRDFSNLQTIMANVTQIEVADSRHSKWTVLAPGGTVSWEAIVTEDVPDSVIAWKSAEGADVANSGRVEFRDAPAGRGSEVRAYIAYTAPGGTIGEWVATLVGREPKLQAIGDLRRFKQLMETGEITISTPGKAAPRSMPAMRESTHPALGNKE